MMVKPTVEKIDDRFQLVVVTSKRARQLAEGAEPLTNKHEPSYVTLAAQEIVEGKVEIVDDEDNEEENN